MIPSPSGYQPDETSLSLEEKLDLIPSIATRAELNALERHNIYAARLWAIRPRQLQRDDLLSDHFARDLHRRMFNGVWRWAGRYRTTEKNLGWEVSRLVEGVHNAFEDSRAWLKFETYPIDEIAVRLHHRLVLIHPWVNGNGRHARLMADLLAASEGGPELTWGAGVDLAHASQVRESYIAAVRHADRGDFSPLVKFARS